MMEGKDDLISELPITILHKMLSFLPIKFSTRTSVLSKEWNSVQKSFPMLFFALNETPRDKERRGEYLDYVDRSLQNFAQNNLRIEIMYLCLLGIDSKSIPLINTWLSLALNNGVSDLYFLVKIVDQAYNPLPETTFVVNSSPLSSGFVHLEKLTLSLVCLSENMVGDIIRNCPNLRILVLKDICGLKTLNISKPNKLESLSITVREYSCELESISGDALSSLECFYLLFEALLPHNPCVIDLSSCYNLRSLSLQSIVITDAFYNLLITSFPLLVYIFLENCHFDPRVRFSLKRLASLNLLTCSGLEVIEFDAPIFSEFNFTPYETNMPDLVSSRVIPGSMHLRYDMLITNGIVNGLWFLGVREFIISAPFEGIIFYPFYEDMKEFVSVGFDIGELIRDEDDEIPRPVEIDCLDLTNSEITASSYWETLLNGLLWSCHPKKVRMELTADSNDGDNCIKIFCRMLMQNECKICSNLDRCKCWRYRLKAAKLESSEGISLDIEKSIQGFEHNLFDSNSELEVLFTLDWVRSENSE